MLLILRTLHHVHSLKVNILLTFFTFLYAQSHKALNIYWLTCLPESFFYGFGRIEFHQSLSYMDIYSIEADVIKIPWLFKSQKNQEVSVTHLSSKRTVISWLDKHRFGATSLSDIFPNVKLFLMQIIIIPTPAQVGGIAAAQVSIHRGWLDTQNTSTLNSTGSTVL